MARIAIAADHGGFEMKEDLRRFLAAAGHHVIDFGTHSTAAVDYPDFAQQVAEAVGAGLFEAGVMIDGAGIGSCMAANKVPGVRAALCYDLSTARNAREHNYANVLTLGAGLIAKPLARQLVAEFLATPWGAERHGRRVQKIMAIEAKYSRGAGR